jgi:hypothetical protein
MNGTQNRIMKTGNWKADWLAPLVGVAVVGGSLMAATTYLNLEQKVRASEAFSVTLDRLYQDQRLSTVLKSMHDGQVKAAAQRLDGLLCQNIIRLDSQLGCADPQTRTCATDAFRRIGLLRPKNAARAAQDCTEDQITAERILARALGEEQIARSP